MPTLHSDESFTLASRRQRCQVHLERVERDLAVARKERETAVRDMSQAVRDLTETRVCCVCFKPLFRVSFVRCGLAGCSRCCAILQCVLLVFLFPTEFNSLRTRNSAVYVACI